MIIDPERVSQAELVAYMNRLREIEASGARSTVAFGPYTALSVIGALQLATRHPGMFPEQRDQILEVVEQFRPWFAGTPGEQLIDMGNDLELDVELDCPKCRCCTEADCRAGAVNCIGVRCKCYTDQPTESPDA